MCRNSCYKTTHGVCQDSLRGELTVAECVEHSGVGAEVAAPAHTDSGEHSDGVTINPALLDEARDKTEGSTYGTKSRDREGHKSWVLEAEEPLEDDVNLAEEPRQEANTLVRSAVVDAIVASGEGENHHQSRDDKHARDNRETYIHTCLTTIEQRVEDACKHRSLLNRLLILHIILVEHSGELLSKLWVLLNDEALHKAC